MMRTRAIVWRLTRQILRDRRLVALALLMPLIIMSILSIIVRSEDAPPHVAVVADGAMSLFIDPILDELEAQGFVLSDAERGEAETAVRLGHLDAMIRFPAAFVEKRARGEATRIDVVVEGVDPAKARNVLKSLRESLAGLMHDMPVLLPIECADSCGDAAKATPPEIDLVKLLGERDEQDYYIPAVAPLLVFFFGYLLTAMAFLRERTGGTLERIFATPLRPIELTLGYFGGFLSLAAVQTGVVLAFMIWVIGVANAGSWIALAALLFFTAVAAEGLGVFLSTLARSEFQVVQFVPLIMLPQVFLSGMFWPIAELPVGLRVLARALPLTYATDAVRDIMLRGDNLRALAPILVVASFAVGSAVLASLTMRRHTY